MKITRTAFADVLLVAPAVFADSRGLFYESFNQRDFYDATGLDVQFVQDSHSHSAKGVLRGMHFQSPHGQGKLVRVLRGAVQDVAVDLRPGSPTQGQCVSTVLSAAEHQSMWIPAGFAHGFLVLSDAADVAYKTTTYYAPQHEHCLAWNDPAVAIEWQSSAPPILSAKDQTGQSLACALQTMQAGQSAGRP